MQVSTMETIDRIEAPTAEYFRQNYLIPNKPVIMTGITDQWPARSKWSQEYLENLSGDRSLNISSMNDGDYVRSKSSDMTLAEFFSELRNPSNPDRKLYLGELPFSQYFPELQEDVVIPDYFDETESTPKCFMYAGQALFSQLHFHTFGSALLSPIRGYKKVRLYAPDQTRHLYKYPWYSGNSNMSKTTSLQPDKDIYPNFSNAKYIDVKLCEGESMFIPIYWWHGISNEDFNIAVVIFWGEKMFRRLPPSALLLDYIWDLMKESPEIASGIVRKIMRSTGLSSSNSNS